MRLFHRTSQERILISRDINICFWCSTHTRGKGNQRFALRPFPYIPSASQPHVIQLLIGFAGNLLTNHKVKGRFNLVSDDVGWPEANTCTLTLFLSGCFASSAKNLKPHHPLNFVCPPGSSRLFEFESSTIIAMLLYFKSNTLPNQSMTTKGKSAISLTPAIHQKHTALQPSIPRKTTCFPSG